MSLSARLFRGRGLLSMGLQTPIRPSCFSSYPSDEKPKSPRKASKYPRIYTRTGDGGNSSLYTGERRPKSDGIFDALGTTDELSSHIGLAYSYAAENRHPYLDHLERIQCLLQDIGSNIATPRSSAREVHLRKVEFNPRHTQELEEWIDEYSKSLLPLKNFILPGGGKTSASLHVARSVCRRAERTVAPLVAGEQVDPEALKYLNRLSDFLFTISRFAARLDKMEETIYTQPGEEESNFESHSDGVWKIKKKSKEKKQDQ
uniref:Corrinoid adenosyltransferase MMAB n=1 Tax=Caligus rogercresseyi TaxID=217165 RepID=C1BNW6_CALRO|nr:CobIyrinic acid a,c-diamide adenosyltransferase, mitochondrial precursor [Caligus rogercresseyi]|eukprot:TRINITY_DN7810_c0_g1_i1.p1 TRINITY_DN7810_c0_g1~~TRINITY_DN7810_c0_g1_i1.p1  ORF type:complete len:260 (+),score=73.54 TRINITY_DN7810_c0_g1_i1:284-1063(+)